MDGIDTMRAGDPATDLPAAWLLLPAGKPTWLPAGWAALKRALAHH